jgi:RNA polymerase sporulation-specific sigma factor
MAGKVEICGVNTSRLKVLKNNETDELLRRCKRGDAVAREELIEGNLRLVLSVLQKFSSRAESADDLFQVGCIGLMKAIDNFDIAQNVRFSTYGVPMIIGEIRRYLRDNSAIRVSRGLRDTAYKALQMKEKLLSETQREPTVDELSRALGICREEIVVALDAITDPVSIYEPLYTENGASVCVGDQIRDTKNCDDNWLEQIALCDAVNSLAAREKRILALRFFYGKTQVEVASMVGISQAQVSRLEKNAIKHIKRHM